MRIIIKVKKGKKKMQRKQQQSLSKQKVMLKRKILLRWYIRCFMFSLAKLVCAFIIPLICISYLSMREFFYLSIILLVSNVILYLFLPHDELDTIVTAIFHLLHTSILLVFSTVIVTQRFTKVEFFLMFTFVMLFIIKEIYLYRVFGSSLFKQHLKEAYDKFNKEQLEKDKEVLHVPKPSFILPSFYNAQNINIMEEPISDIGVINNTPFYARKDECNGDKSELWIDQSRKSIQDDDLSVNQNSLP